jgi:hypothetical protein
VSLTSVTIAAYRRRGIYGLTPLFELPRTPYTGN